MSDVKEEEGFCMKIGTRAQKGKRNNSKQQDTGANKSEDINVKLVYLNRIRYYIIVIAPDFSQVA